MDYLPLEKVAAELLKKIQTLKSGEMASTEISGLVDSSRDVYERLVVLEFQALEKKIAPVQELKPFKIDTEARERPAAEKEINIQEAEEERKELEKKKPIKITIEEPEASVEKVVPAKEKEASKAKPVESAEEKPELESKETIAEKFENAPIESIAQSITLNEKFQFIRVLCGNNAQNFQILLDKIRESKDEKSALNIFSTLITKPSIEEEIEVYEKFEELIKRRL
jgi:hypothetical protein